uniref:SFRICE_000421 n=1 Tax=Spodoptera frugiperda TaxID=7108 RepID=A0A2H1VQY8_SPOFR
MQNNETMKKFLYEYKSKKTSRCKSETNTAIRERVTVTTHHSVSPIPTTPEAPCSHSTTQIGTIRTEEYKRDLAEFQARRSIGSKEPKDTPVKKKCGRHSLPVSCTDCTADHDNTFNYEKKSAIKYKKKQKRARSTTPERSAYGGLPNIQFLFQNQVFMPGNLYPTTSSFSEPQKYKRQSRHSINKSPDMDMLVQKHIDFKEDDQTNSPPAFYKNNSLPFDVKNFLDGHKSDDDEVDGVKASGDVNLSSQHAPPSPRKDVSDDKLWEVMSELKNLDQWADEQLQVQSPHTSKSDDSKSDASTYGLPIACASNLDVTVERNKTWNYGKWGVVPVQIKRLNGVTVEHVRKKRNTEINILRKCRHPNIILLMGLYPDIHNNVHLICERCVDSLYGILHVQGRILSAQTAVQYALDVANALVFLQMQGYLHTELCSSSVMITSHDAAKLADMAACTRLHKPERSNPKDYDLYSPEPQYVNIDDSRQSDVVEFQPLISAHPSETYISSNAVAKEYKIYENSEKYRWHAPELFLPSEEGLVYPCSKSDVYSLCLILWESCNAAMPWKNLSYNKLKEQYTLWKTGIPLPTDGTYPGCLLSLLQSGLMLQRHERMDLTMLQSTLQNVKRNIDDLGYIIIPARLPTKRSTFSSTAWDTTSPTDSECLSPQNIQHQAVVHNARESSTESEKDCTKSDASPLYETIRKSHAKSVATAEKCFISDDDQNDHASLVRYEHLQEKEYSSACSTPIAKIKARMKDIGTPGTLHRSDSTEYCNIFSPNRTINFTNDEETKDRSTERPHTKLSRSFTPKSYKPLHIKVPDVNCDSIKPLLKDRNSSERSSYNFDIRNYSLPSTPIARSNKLRKNAWLSGELGAADRSQDKTREADNCVTPEKEEHKNLTNSSLESAATPINTSVENPANSTGKTHEPEAITPVNSSPEVIDPIRDVFTGLRRVNPPPDFSPECEDVRDRMSSCSLKSSHDKNALTKYKIEEDILANVNVKPLVAIHEKWIYEANRKTCRSMSLPEDNRSQIAAVKPASHCVDTLQKSLPQLNLKKPGTKIFRTRPASPINGKNGNQWDQFCQARETIAKSVNFNRSPDLPHRRFEVDKETTVESQKSEHKIDQSTDTKSIEDFIRDMIRKEFQHLLQELTDDASTGAVTISKSEDILNKGVANIIESLNNNEDMKSKKEPTRSFSRVKINGNNKPLLQITFTRTGENSLQVLDNCVNVTICDPSNNNVSMKDKMNQSLDDTLTDDIHVNALKRCQAFNALQEAKSTEDLYIDDDLSTMQENFGGKVKLIPLHGSLHEILCEKEDDCCLIKVKQENGCDTIYFRCDNSDTESRDAIDGCPRDHLPQDTVVYKRSISLVEERIQRVFPKEKRAQTPNLSRKTKPPDHVRIRPKSEVFVPKLTIESRVLSNSSPSLATCDRSDEVEVNIENVLSYQDSSSDECIKCQLEGDDFEFLEKKIEEDIANSNKISLACGCLAKISEENLATLNEDKD